MHSPSARALLAAVVDYAGLFPPAALSMPEAVAEYAAAAAGRDAWMLGRFVLTAARLPEFAEVMASMAAPAAVWRLSAIVRDGSQVDRDAIGAFNAASADHHAIVDTIECKPQTLDGIDWLAEAFSPSFDVYVEVTAGDEGPRWLERLGERGLKGKVRTGGLTPDAFPSPAALLTFIEAALRSGVPFKATAGLHHAVRGSYRLTYEDHAPQAPMYGYLNLILATAATRAGLSRAAVEQVLCQTDASSLVFTGEVIRWGEAEWPADVVRGTRTEQLVSFGSCSFREPVDELHSLIPNS
jgi:hypothetical protein